LKSPFSFEGELDRRTYAAASAAVFFSQHLLILFIRAANDGSLKLPWWFWFNPLRAALLRDAGSISPAVSLPSWVLPWAMILAVAINGLLAALAFRRARHAGAYEGLAALAAVPGIQVLAILWLSAAPPRRVKRTAPETAAGRPMARTAAKGVLVGAALCVSFVAVSTLVLRVYGYGLFLASPLVIGLTTAFIANHGGDVGLGKTCFLVNTALLFGALALVGFAFEGVICLLLASPIIAAMGFIGALIGRALALRTPRRRDATMMGVAVVPLMLLGELVLPPKVGFESIESVEVTAPPAAVWDAVVHMGPIPDAPAAPFRWGLAYPMRGEILGAGVGAIRRGVFSTGVAYERVTEWAPNRKLSFIVLSDPPTMHELSPYRRVNAPHVIGYFKTLDARFTITPLANGKTRLSLATRHELDLEPALYWLPIAQWATHANKVRVLQHFRRQAEASVG
jgi:hypothetical protein